MLLVSSPVKQFLTMLRYSSYIALVPDEEVQVPGRSRRVLVGSDVLGDRGGYWANGVFCGKTCTIAMHNTKHN
jgi:hypothetical protein